MAKALDLPGKDSGLASKIYDRVQEKLKREAVEDFRIDFEDGYGNRPDSEEDHHAEAAAKEVARGMKEQLLHLLSAFALSPSTKS